MADRTIKPDDTNDLVLQNNDGSAKIEVNEAQTVVLSGGSTTALTIDTSGDVKLTQDIYLASGKGIYFDGGTTSENYLGGSDAYEEGTWSPDFSSHTGTEDQQVGTYTKVGRLVTVYFALELSSGGANTGNFISGLPFTVSNNNASGTSHHGMGTAYDDTNGFSVPIPWSNTNTLRMTDLDPESVTSTGETFIRGMATYFTS